MNEFDYFGFIYLTTNMINGKKYIGKHSMFTRKGEFKKNNHTYLGSGVYLSKAIKKYGRENFIREILCFAKDEEELNYLEREFINNHNAILSKDYYNIAEGGEGANTILGFSDEEYEEYCKSVKERYEDEEFKEKFTECCKNSWTDERKEKASKTTKKYHEEHPELAEKTRQSNFITWQNEETRNKRIENSSKKIIQLDLDGNYIAEFINGRIASESIGVKNGSRLIRRVCNNKKGTAYGYKWLFKSDYDELNKNV